MRTRLWVDTNEEISGKTWRERDRNKEREWGIYFMWSNLGKILGILTLQIYQILQLPCPNLVVGSLLKLALTIPQMNLSAVESWPGGRGVLDSTESMGDPVWWVAGGRWWWPPWCSSMMKGISQHNIQMVSPYPNMQRYFKFAMKREYTFSRRWKAGDLGRALQWISSSAITGFSHPNLGKAS